MCFAVKGGLHMRSRLLCVCMCLFVVAGCRTTCDEVLESSAAANHVSVTSVAAIAAMAIAITVLNYNFW